MKQIPVVSPVSYSVSITSIGNGSIDLAGLFNVEEGSSLSINIKPDTGNEIEYIKINGISQEISSNIIINDIRQNYTIEISFTPILYSISVSTVGKGSVDPNGVFEIIEGSSSILNIEADYGYKIESITVNGIAQEIKSELVLFNITQNVYLEVMFSPKSFKILFDSTPGSLIEPIEVLYGDSIPTLPIPFLKDNIFVSWYSDMKFENLFVLDLMPGYDLTLYALYEEVLETTLPPIVLLNPSLDTITQYHEYVEKRVTIIHHLETQLEIETEVDIATPGQYFITYTVSDIYGNVTKIYRVVTVTTKKPTVSFFLNPAISTLLVGDNFYDTGCTAIVNQETIVCGVKYNNIDTSKAGVYQITYFIMFDDTEYTYSRCIFVIDTSTKLLLFYESKREDEVPYE